MLSTLSVIKFGFQKNAVFNVIYFVYVLANLIKLLLVNAKALESI